MLDSEPTAPRACSWPSADTEGEEIGDLDQALFRPGLALRDWLLAEGTRLQDWAGLLAGLAERLNALGVPVDRMTTAIDALHSEYAGVGRRWTREGGYTSQLFPHGEASERAYERSPFAEAHRTGRWLVLDLRRTPDDAFDIIPELKAEGYVFYICVPLCFTNGTRNGVTFATRAEHGFDRRALSVLRFVMPTLAAVLETRSVNQRLDNVLRIYVGNEPHKAILSGTIQRGQVSRIRSAILFADMRGYTRISSGLEPERAVELLNTFFDCLVPPIEAQGGEVLKYLGDGLLAIFPDNGDDTGGSAQAALSAATAALVKLDEANRAGRFPAQVEAGIALHHGEAAYGNVGSGARLDFTVIGPDVNLASRIAEMNKVLGEPLLLSKAFADHLGADPEMIGRHPLDGFLEPVPIYRLRPDGPSRKEQRELARAS
ncbi:adenylate/guanylate cyclase domain-containing protein [Enterovirga aerilata]|uniref:Adenylate/guanylate cyclase domain-containing protein n=1 Tax=Enterovirga aerilata TaxID=2730920 RepID=A0A849I5C2_9HYPH|nr:adenylate/guanylate cyclase domain-containing protein [Enterovirga sp. DB1703]NNM74652.1 adenylate/guanylate cyclase domain-containing protein [Enterovirga sp. DB1703]